MLRRIRVLKQDIAPRLQTQETAWGTTPRGQPFGLLKKPSCGWAVSGMASWPNPQAPGGSLRWDLQEILEVLGMARQAKDCSAYIQVPTAIDP